MKVEVALPISLESPHLLVEIDPSRGGAITRLMGGPSRDEWLFYDAQRGARWPADHLVYDDVWRGGFEELFPNDAPGRFDGRSLPDHGELWNRPFDVLAASPTGLHMRRHCTTVPVDLEKSVSLDGSVVTVSYRLSNRADTHLWHLLKLHPALRVEPGDRLLLPGGSVVPVEPGFGAVSGPGPYEWPMASDALGKPVDLSLVRPIEERFREFVYVTRLPEGWCGIRRQRTGESLKMTFPLSVFPFCWLFLTYGGWREYNTAVVEPCTNVPKDLELARGAGTCATLQPRETKAFSVRLELLQAYAH